MATNGGAINGKAELGHILQQDADQGRVAVHSFDPNASPSEKGAAAGKARDALKPINAQEGAGNQGYIQGFSLRVVIH